MRIAHLADVHLDRPFVGLALDAPRARRADLMDALRRCVAVARERGVDAITIGGDLWEDENVTADTRASVAHALAQSELPVVIVAGNHDPVLRGGLYERTAWPDNVRLITSSAGEEIALGDVVIRASSWTERQPSPRDLLLAPAADVRPRVALFHGTAADARFPAAGAYCEFQPRWVREGPCAVALVGHIHDASVADGVVYPGSPEPLSRTETGRHCCAIVDISAAAVEVELIDINRRSYRAITVDCDGATSSEEVETRARAALGEPDERVIVNLELIGETAPDCALDVEVLAARLQQDFAGVSIGDRSQPRIDYERLRDRRTADGLFVAELLRKLESEADPRQRQVLELALRAGVRALAGHKDVLHVG